MPDIPLEVDVVGGVAWLTFNNPARHNALTMEMCDAIVGAIADAEGDSEIRAIALRGSGEAAFMSGADIDQQGAHGEAFGKAASGMLQTLANVEKPLIAMIHGFCLGGGLSVALQADVRFASSESCYAVPAAKLGIGYPINSVGPLLALVGPAVASDILFSGRRLDAEEAAAVGLVSRIVEPQRLHEEAEIWLAGVARNAPLSIRVAKATLRAARPQLTADQLAALDVMLRECETSSDYQEGQAAFHERREPRFVGR